MYKYVNKSVTQPLMNLFTAKESIYKTRTHRDPKATRSHFEPLSKSFLSKGPMLWSHIPMQIKDCVTIHSFVRNVKRYLLSN